MAVYIRQGGVTGIWPNILVNLDATNVGSYPGTGTTWFDLSGNNNNATLFNGSSFDTDVRGNIRFDGNDDYSDIQINGITSNIITIEMVVRWNRFNGGMFWGFNTYDIWTNGNGLGYNTGGGDLYGISGGRVAALNLINNYKVYHFVVIGSGNIPTFNRIYINGNVETLSQQGGNTTNANGFNSGGLRISGWRNGGYSNDMNIPLIRIYNRQLSDSEINSSAAIFKARFNIS